MLWILLACARDPYRDWPDPETVFPYVYTLETDLEPYEEVRWETETWTLEEDPSTAALYLLKAGLHRPGAPVESLEHFEVMREAIPPVGEGIRLSFAGDVMWVGDNWAHFADPAAGMLDGDLRIGNLETPTAPGFPTEPDELGLYHYNAPPEMLDGLPLDLLQLTNNHVLDVGDPGLEGTLAEVEARGYASTGVDDPVTVEVAGQAVSVLAYTWGINDRGATSTHDLHIVPFGHLDEDVDLSGIAAEIGAARQAGVDQIVVLVHWGYEYEYYPDPHFMILGREIVALGADLVVGEGPHCVQPPEICHVNDPYVIPGVGTCSVRTEDGVPRTAAIAYSLGDFGTTLETWPLKAGIVLTATLGEGGVTELGWAAEATVTRTNGPEVWPMEALVGEEPDAAVELARLGEHLGMGWAR